MGTFIDQACLVQVAGYWPRSLLCFLFNLDFISVHKNTRKTWQICGYSVSGPHTWSIKFNAFILNSELTFYCQVSGYHIGCDFSPDGSIISSGSADGQIYFYDHHTSHMVRTLQAHSMPCMDVAFHPTLPNCVASCGWEGQVKVWK